MVIDPLEDILKVPLTESSSKKLITVFSSERHIKSLEKLMINQMVFPSQQPESLSVTLICNTSVPTSTFSGMSTS